MSGPTLTIPEIVAQRGITEILHFTTSFGLTGIAAKDAVLCRDLLDQDQYLEHIGTPVWPSRAKDADWTGYVNMSISRISSKMFFFSRRKLAHVETWWPVLSFGPAILNDPGVVFTTTNNSYAEVIRRAEGPDGLEAMFGPSIPWGRQGSVLTRNREPTHWTTDPQAEVLYPTYVDLTYLQAIYVETEDLVDEAYSVTQLWAGTASVPVIHKPEVFQ